MNGEMPEIEMVTGDADASLDPSMLKALLLRRFAHDVTVCDETRQLLTALGLTHGSDEGYEIDHLSSHQRMGLVAPLESLLSNYSEIMGVVVSTALTEGHGVTQEMGDDNSIIFAQQNAKVVLSSSRAIISQLIFMGVLTYGPASMYIQEGSLDV